MRKNGSHEPCTTGERWQTITIPMTKFGNYDPTEAPDATFANICVDRNSGSYRNFPAVFANSDLESSDDIVCKVQYSSTQKAYIDNIRVVSIAPISGVILATRTSTSQNNP